MMKIRNVLIFMLCLNIFSTVKAQEIRSGGVIKFKLKTIPELQIKDVNFFDEDKNDFIDAGENCYFDIVVVNNGKTAANCPIIETKLANGEYPDLVFDKTTNGKKIPPGQNETIRVNVSGSEHITTDRVTFMFILSEDGKYATKPTLKITKTKKKDVYMFSDWQHPKSINSTVSEDKIKISLCLKSEQKIDSVFVYVNDKLKNKSNNKKIKKSSECGQSINELVRLEKGLNEIKVKVSTQGKSIVTESRYVHNSPFIVEYRNALVIGNGKYKVSPLKNPVKDAKVMTEELRKLDFNVIEVIDGNKKAMRDALRKFNVKMKDEGGIGLFYYAGHGMQVKGENYLIPINNDIVTEYDVQDESLRVNTVLNYMQDAGTRMNIVILDACRDNPFISSSRSGSRGLATVQAEGSGAIIAYSTAPGSTASDGEGEHGLYTQELLKAIKTPGLEIGMVFRNVLANVQRLSSGKQIPWTSSSIIGEFYFSK